MDLQFVWHPVGVTKIISLLLGTIFLIYMSLKLYKRYHR